ncbi:hypothetical protein M2139_001627 [Enterococcus sp. PF1-24]|uniref:hypothetical protein n=1 Tax=unclassified Enterococcus TaxID=2608891 RepID=UPI002476DB38|nr:MULTISPECIES: hypothetical protein [unclassified Enterococcus]MDH6364640.1 hypothetical protein [Enterococcus sp. PFB1-1]MDH6401741.1 hypothetical protein [Enterococcus sp. PF1-24]
MENKHATDGIAEDLIRCFIQLASVELHTKTLIEKAVSELENGISIAPVEEQLAKITDLQAELIETAQRRRDIMLFLYEVYGSQGDKQKWCTVKHLGLAMMTAFEAWQASDNNQQLNNLYLKINELFLKNLTSFLGVEITTCAACFADIIKGEDTYEII